MGLRKRRIQVERERWLEVHYIRRKLIDQAGGVSVELIWIYKEVKLNHEMQTAEEISVSI